MPVDNNRRVCDVNEPTEISAPDRGSQPVAAGHRSHRFFVYRTGFGLPACEKGLKGVVSLAVGCRRSKRLTDGVRRPSEQRRQLVYDLLVLCVEADGCLGQVRAALGLDHLILSIHDLTVPDVVISGG